MTVTWFAGFGLFVTKKGDRDLPKSLSFAAVSKQAQVVTRSEKEEGDRAVRMTVREREGGVS